MSLIVYRRRKAFSNTIRIAGFICQDCGRKYPIVDDIPVMLIDEGDKWMDTEKIRLAGAATADGINSLAVTILFSGQTLAFR